MNHQSWTFKIVKIMSLHKIEILYIRTPLRLRYSKMHIYAIMYFQVIYGFWLKLHLRLVYKQHNIQI
jgi:hypothetical protein